MLILGAYTCVIGLLNVVGGASRDSRFYRVDDVVVRALGIAFLLLGAGLLSGQRWAAIPLAAVYLASIVEAALTFRRASLVITALVFFVPPLLYLAQTSFR